MKTPEFPTDEKIRIKTLQSLNVLDTPAEERFDRLTALVSKMFNVPIALVSLIDSERQWFKSSVGLEASETPRDISFCGHAILGEDVFLVPNALEDERFADNPLVTGPPNIRFYAGQPLKHANGSRLGTLCLIDDKPRTLDVEELRLLKQVAILVELELVQGHSVTMDEETGLSNQEGFFLLGNHSLKICQKMDLSVTVAFLFVNGLLDLKVNSSADLYHQSLAIISQEFKRGFRSSDVVARYDDSGFVALLTNTDETMAEENLQRISDNIEAQFANLEQGPTISLSSGIVRGQGSDDLEQLVFNAFVNLHEKSE